MSRVRLCLTFVLSLSAALLVAAQRPVYRSGTHTVSIYATVVDATGRLVTTLTRDDFEVFDNGRARPISVFASDPQPITIVVMLDRSGSMAHNAAFVQRAADEFIANLLPGDRMRLGSFSARIEIDPETFTSDHEALRRILREKLQPPGPTPLWSAADAAMTALAGQDGRRVVLIFTDGKDTPGWLGPNSPSFDAVRARAQQDETMVYGIGLSDPCEDITALAPHGSAGQPRLQRPGRIPGGRRLPPGRLPIPVPLPTPLPPGPRVPGREFPPPTPPFAAPRRVDHGCVDEAPDPELRVLAEDGGGGYFELQGTDDLDATFARVAEELHHQYVLAFTTAELDGTVHQLDVRVRRPGMTARARKSYFAPLEPAGP
jgi:VWFA-related protein